MNTYRLLLIAILLTLFQTSFAQSSINFETGFLPESNYRQSTKTINTQVMTYKGSKDVQRVLEAKGIENPTRNISTSDMDVAIQTGKMSGNGKFQMVFEYLRYLKGDKSPLPPGTKLYGTAGLNQVPQVDSVSGDMSAEFKESLIKGVEAIFENYKMPARQMKVGDSFEQVTPVNMPISGMNITMEIKTTYKLTKVQDGKALFKIKQTYTFRSDNLKFKLTGGGKGKGTLEYDVEKKFISNYQSQLKMDMKMDIEQITIVLNQVTEMSQVTVKVN